MLGLAELMPPTFNWQQIEQALLRIAPQKWDAASRVGLTTDSGGLLVRISVSDDLRRELERVAGRPLTPRATNNSSS
jgi:hypothetical protein